MPTVTLYIMYSCPFCRKVLHFMGENNIEIPIKDINESSEIRDELMTIGGKTQVPCLVVDGTPIYESDRIIDWLSQNYKERK